MGSISDGNMQNSQRFQHNTVYSKKRRTIQQKGNVWQFCVQFQTSKTEKYRIWLPVGGDEPNYPDDATSPTSTLAKTKLIINSTISDAHKGAGACFMSTD